MFRFILITVIGLMPLAGCGPSQPAVTGIPAPTVPATPAKPAQMCEHPEYTKWKNFKAGTMVTRQNIITKKGTDNKVITTETFRLLEASKFEIKVQRQKTVERIGEDASVVTSAPDSRNSPATFALPEGLSEEAYNKPSADAKRVGEETLTVLGKSYKCDVYTFVNPTDGAGPMTVKVWWSLDMPGRVVQTTTVVPGNGTQGLETVTALTLGQ